jgi:hypothetical protein
MSWFSTLFSPVLRLFGIGKPRDTPIPSPLPNSDTIQLHSDGSDRAEEALRALRGHVRAPYQITDRSIHIACLPAKDAKAYFVSRGNKPGDWPKNRIGMFYPPKAGEPFPIGIIHLVDVKLDQPDRVRLALHEGAGHTVWHWLLTSAEWGNWLSHNWSHEDFADDLTRRLLGEKLDKAKTRWFDALEARLAESGKAQRL